LEGNGRMENIESQLAKHPPTEKVYLLVNKGFKKCKKKKHIDKPPLDLIDAFYTVFKEARIKRYDNILILEDDFFFDEEAEVCAKDVDDFLYDCAHRNREKYIYYLGAIPFLQTDFGGKHPSLLLSMGTHACIYSKGMIDTILNKVDQLDLTDWDTFLNFSIYTVGNKYKYRHSLCYQLFPETENQKHWVCSDFICYFLRKAQLDQTVYPGYEISETAARFVFRFLLFTVCLLLFLLYNKKMGNNPFFILLALLVFLCIYPLLLLIILCVHLYVQIICHPSLSVLPIK